LIDEVPIIAVAATRASGTTIIRGAGELRVKESDRLAAMARELPKMGARLEEKETGLIISGGTPLHGAICESYSDHRVAMALAIAGLVAKGTTRIRDAEFIATSFPDFYCNLQNFCS
jgi:3-phosphoshikimate 1-carboxyvinyltransferase